MVDMKLLANPKFVIVEWEDCESMEGWHSELDVKEYIDRPLSVMRSVGYLFCDDERWVILAQSVDVNQEEGIKAADFIKIPRAMVRDMCHVDGTHPNARAIALSDVPVVIDGNMPSDSWKLVSPDGQVVHSVNVLPEAEEEEEDIPRLSPSAIVDNHGELIVPDTMGNVAFDENNEMVYLK